MLRVRLFLNWIPFVAILLGVGLYAFFLFSRLLGTVDATVTQNYQSATAAQAMGTALEKMNTALQIVADNGDKGTGTSQFNEYDRRFAAELQLVVKNVETFGKTNLVSQLQTNYALLHEAGLKLVQARKTQEQRELYEGKIVPRIISVKMLLEQMGEISHKNILATTQNIQEITRHIRRVLTWTIVIALAISVVASWQFGRGVLRPIQMLTKATSEVGQGNLDQTVPIISHDELGELAVAFNKMAVQLKAYRQSTAEKIMRLHRTMVSTIASFPDPIFVLDHGGHIELKNPAADALLERLGLKNVLPAYLPETAAEVLRSGNDFQPHSFKEVLPLRVNGEERAFLPRIMMMRGQAQEPVGVAVVLHDVTRFRLLDDAKTNLVATVSHELKTPLTSVRMALHLLLEKNTGPLSRKQADLVETARMDSERLLRILNDLLDLTRLEAGKSGLNKECLMPGELVQTIFDEAQRGVTEAGLKFNQVVEPNLPRVWVDAPRIGHVFHNFIRNAIRHSPAGGKIEIHAARSEDGGVEFSVIDQGPGVPEEYTQRIFDRFFRVPGQTKSGAGLGLSIAREIVVAHGGRIGVRSAPERGSEFYFVLASVEDDGKTTFLPATRA